VLTEADSVVAGVLHSIGYAVNDVATALENVFTDAALQAASAQGLLHHQRREHGALARLR
jgi:hypothetical protein